MTIKAFRIILIFALGIGLSPLVAADDASATRTIARVLLGLNHFPSEAEQTALMSVANDESNSRAFRVLATAVHNIRHAATEDDREAVSAVLSSPRATPTARALAQIVLEFNHAVSDAARARLQEML